MNSPLLSRTAGAVLLIIVVLGSLSPMLIVSPAEGAPPGAQERIWIAARAEFDDLLNYRINVTMQIFTVNLNGTMKNATDLRSMYQTDKEQILSSLDGELRGRTLDLITNSMGGDAISIASSSFDHSTFSISADEGDPVVQYSELTGKMDLSQIMDEETISSISQERYAYVASGLLIGGFHFSRTLTLRADPGQRVRYVFPTAIDAVGDGAVSLVLHSSGFDDKGGYYEVVVDSELGEFSRTFPFRVLCEEASIPSEESVEGGFTLDWYQLDKVDLTGNVHVESVQLSDVDRLQGLPGSMTPPNFVGSGFMGWAIAEGLLDEDDILEIEEMIAGEVEESISPSLEDQEMSVTADLDRTAVPDKPGSGDRLLEDLSTEAGLDFDVSISQPVLMDVLDGYELLDVIDLLHGGFQIWRELEPVTDDRFDVVITLPEDLVFDGEEAVSVDSGRRTYQYPSGLMLISSAIAPGYSEESVLIRSRIDISDVRSHYFSDMEISLDSETALDIHVLKYDPEEFTFETELDYSIDFLNSDVIRLLVKMGIADISDIEGEIEEEIRDLLSDLVREEDLDISVELDQETLSYERDDAMDDSTPILVSVAASGTAQGLDGSMTSSTMAGNRFIPHHMDPLIKVRTVQKTVDLSSVGDWDMDIEVRFPSGVGIEAWMGNDSNDRAGKLEVVIEDSYPVLRIDSGTAEGDRVLLMIEIGPYFGFNNVTVCFVSGWSFLGLAVLLVAFIIIRGMVRRRKRQREEEDSSEEGEEGEEDDADQDSAGELKW
ncbi:MAG: hypothetical protein ACMUIE_06590 [Thermoplasmatota archaeon]